MSSKSFEYAKDITVAALQGKSLGEITMGSEKTIMKFFKGIYEELRKIEQESVNSKG